MRESAVHFYREVDGGRDFTCENIIKSEQVTFLMAAM